MGRLGRLRRSRRAIGVAAAVAVLAVAAVLDVPGRLGTLTPADPPVGRSTPTSSPTTDPGELVPAPGGDRTDLDRCTPGSAVLARCGPAPALDGDEWVGSDPLDLADLRGSVVLVAFFSSSCVACGRDARYLTAWQRLYGRAGLRVVGVDSPQFAFEQDPARLAQTLRDRAITFPVLHDTDSSVLAGYRTDVRPSTYLLDRDGTVRAVTLGEGGHFRVEAQIRKLLAEGRAGTLPDPLRELDDGEDAEPGTTPQIDLADSRGARYDEESDTVTTDGTRFRLPDAQPIGTFSFGGPWTVGRQDAVPGATGVARVSFRGRTAYQLVGGSGSLVVTSTDGTVRRIRVDGDPEPRRIHVSETVGPETLTVRYEGDLRVYAFAFG